MNRRRFLQCTPSLSLIAGSAIGAGLNTTTVKRLEEMGASINRQILIVNLSGAWDGYQTIIPLRHYASIAQLRPNLALPRNKVLQLPFESHLGFHPAAAELHQLYKAGKMIILPQVGFAKPMQSHHEAVNKWSQSFETAFSEELTNQEIQTIHCFRSSRFVSNMKSIAQTMLNQEQHKLFKIELGGFDLHQNQVHSHDSTLGTYSELVAKLSKGIQAFQSEISSSSKSKEVLVVVTTDFGRSIQENDQLGTEHGNAFPMMLISEGINGGLAQNFSKEAIFDLVHNSSVIDVESIFPMLKDHWLGASSKSLLHLI